MVTETRVSSVKLSKVAEAQGWYVVVIISVLHYEVVSKWSSVRCCVDGSVGMLQFEAPGHNSL